jgi:hypothetical protein
MTPVATSSAEARHALPLRAVEAWLRNKPREQAEIALALRDLVLTIVPHAQERILRRGLSYHDPRRGGPVKGSLCQIEFYPDQLRLSFIHGAFLNDPARVLGGDRKAKRFVKLFTYQTVPWSQLEGLIRQASGLDTSRLEIGLLKGRPT